MTAKFEATHSSEKDEKFVYSYTVTIENKSNTTVQLLNRHWIIIDSHLNVREVKGDGVVGQQPILSPGEMHRYSSWSPLSTDIGKMKGSFGMVSEDGKLFSVTIPAFLLCFPPRLN